MPKFQPSDFGKKEKKSEIDSYVSLESTEYQYVKNRIIFYLLNKDVHSATECLVDYIKLTEHIYAIRSDKSDELWIYKEGIYVPHGKTYIEQICRDMLNVAFTPQKANEVIAKIRADTYINYDDFFINECVDEVAIKNGILNVVTKEMQPFTHEKRFFNKLNINYNEEKDCPNIKKHFDDVLKNDEDKFIIQELFGFLLLREYRYENAFMFIGDGRNGKSKTLALIKSFLGIDNCASITLEQIENDTYAAGELFGKLVNLAGDIDSTMLRNISKFKALTGRDQISTQRKFLDMIKFVNYAKMIFAANKLPIISYNEQTSAVWRRWIVIDFPYTFISLEEYLTLPDEEKINYRIADPEIISKITTEDELSGLLNWAIEGLDRIRKNKKFSYSRTTSEIKEMWMMKSDSFTAFCEKCVDEDYENYVLKGELRKEYLSFCHQHKLKLTMEKHIKKILFDKYAVTDDRVMVDGRQQMVWRGIKIKEKLQLNSDSLQALHNLHPISTLYEKYKLDIGIKQGANHEKGANEEYVDDKNQKNKENTKIYQKCDICGLTPCVGFDIYGKPYCELCKDHVQLEEEVIDEESQNFAP